MKVTQKRTQQPLTNSGKPSASGALLGNQPLMTNVSSRLKVSTIGASTGALPAIQKILGQLPANFPLPIICTVHVSQGVLSNLVNWLSSQCSLRAKIAEVGESPLPGIIYFAPEKCDLEFDNRGKFIYSNCPVADKHCPSITVTFKSVAKLYGKATAAVLLTGIGKDGAEGLQAISQAGGITVGQEGAFGMVKEAIALNAVQQVLSIDKITPFLLKNLSD